MEQKKNKQTGQYDKIFKENLEAVLPGLMKNLLGITAVLSEEIPDDIQHTKERKPDFLKKITDIKNKTYILHIEIQVADESEMIYRMAEYNIMLLRKYHLPVHQFVIFLGKAKPKMKTTLNEGELSFRFNVLSLRDLNYRIFIESEKPEEVVFAILGDFGKEEAKTAVEQIIQRLGETTRGQLSFQKYLRQLHILVKLRKFDLKLDEIMESIAKYIDEERDVLYLRGLEKGKEPFVVYLLKDAKHTYEQIANLAGVSIEFVKTISGQLNDSR